MHINDLPEDILILIIQKYAYYTGVCEFGRWKKILPLSATCRLWRTITMPYLFNRVQLDYSNEEVVRKIYVEGDNIDEPNDEVITTNADIIAAAGQTSLVKHVGITIFYLADPFPGLFAALKHLAGLPTKWSSVQSLKIQLVYNRGANNVSSRDMSRFDNAIPSVVKDFTLLLPSIVDLKFCGNGNNNVASLLYGQLLDAYSEQTTQLEINQPLSLTNSYVLNKLTYLKINLIIVKSCQLYGILADTLVSLTLQCIPYTYDWSTFAIESEPKVIEFPNLTTLKVGYILSLDYKILIDSGKNYKPQWPILHLPKLKYFKYDNSQAIIPLLEYSMLPKELQCLKVYGSIETISRLERHTFPVLKFLSMSVSYNDSDLHINPFTVINQVASKTQCTTDVEMNVKSALSNEILSNISCSALKRLTISTLIDKDTIPRLLQGLPNLKDLALLTITEVDEQTCSIVAEYEKHKANNALPLNSSIEKLKLIFVNGNETMATATTIVKYLLPRLPALSELCASQIPALAIEEFVHESKNYYPHLDTIKYKLSQ